MTGARCAACGTMRFPACLSCPDCGAPMEPAELGGVGRIETWTTVHRAPPRFETPYVLAWVQLEKEGLRVLARFTGDGEPRLGAAVDVALSADGDDALIVATAAGSSA